MKKLYFGIIAMLSLTFVACESNETPMDLETAKLESYSFERDMNGNAVLEHVTTDGYSTELNSDLNEGIDKYIFNESPVLSTTYKNAVNFDNGQVKIGFYGVEGNRNEMISVEDDELDRILAKGSSNPLLKSYRVVRWFNGKVYVFFQVKDGVSVSYGYNEELGENEIQLKEAEGRQLWKNTHVQSYNMNSADGLIVTFVSDMGKASAKSISTLSEESLIRKPRIIVSDPDDTE
jgi:hypothetical protein